ncbi:hypothetical protein BJ878DRAFT_538356 [Calycina marina]|uniref:GAG-pre-integrase domain-containing protein n=1 Tax=Calycina marina TaxID=1763456 RepID=A0A9P7ZAL7_9HELO|nr:hypothetical protein BJ878DRAFT_538356 [Calycina marina]
MPKENKDSKDFKPHLNVDPHQCKHCKDPKAIHADNQCFVVNKQGREWYEKTFKKDCVPCFRKKDDDDYNSSEDGKAPSKNKKRSAWIALDNYNPQASSNLQVMTSNGVITPVVSGSRTLLCSTGYEVRLGKVFYLPNCAVNLFGAKTLFATGKLRQKITPEGTVITNEDGEELFYLDENCYVCEEPACAFLVVVTPRSKETSIDHLHRRLCHLSKDNVRKIAKFVKGIIIRNDQVLIPDEREELTLKKCDPCEKSNPKHTSCKTTTRRVDKAFDKMHVDVVMYNKRDLEDQRYATVFTDKATGYRWVYTKRKKSGAYEAVLLFDDMVKTQYNRTIKVWRLDDGKEYSPKMMAKMAAALAK